MEREFRWTPTSVLVQDSVLRPSDIGIILSYKCTSSCKHCLYNCGPRWKDWMDPETLTDALTATREWFHHYKIHLTGGEPFLNLPLLKHGISEAKRLGIRHYVETSAFWCRSEKKVNEVFMDLKDAGLEEILISCSPFHAETIPPARTFLAIEVASRIFGPGNLQVYLPHCIRQVGLFNAEGTTPIGRYVEAFGLEGAGRMLWDGYSIIPGGRSGYELGFLTRKHPARHFAGDNCFREILYAHHSHFDLYGNYISWFCGGLSIGSWRELRQVLERFRKGQYPTLVDTLVRNGPYGLYELASSEWDYVEQPDGYAGKCHLCVDVRQHLSNHSDTGELEPKAFYDNF